MTDLWSYSLILVLAVNSIVVGLQGEDSLEAIKRDWVAAVSEADIPAKKLLIRYQEKLDELAAEAQKQGNLEKVLLIQTERDEVAETPSKKFAGYVDLNEARNIYDRQRSILSIAKQEKLKQLQRTYGVRFDKLISELTKAGNLNEAVLARDEKQSILATIPKELEFDVPRSKEELVAYLDDTIWSYDDRDNIEGRLLFSKGQKLQGIKAESEDPDWRMFQYTVSDDLTVLFGRWEIRFSNEFTKFENRNGKGEGDVVASGEFLERKPRVTGDDN